jgi:aminoglycoside phosphotransferase (APT) family kinase protein
MNDATLTPAGLNAESVTRWLSANVAGSVAPFHFELIAGGHSNLTFSVTDSAIATCYADRRSAMLLPALTTWVANTE